MASRAQILKVFRGDSFPGTIYLDEVDESGRVTDFDLTGVTAISINFPGTSAVVSLTLAGSEVTVADADHGKITFVGPSSKSPDLKLSTSDTDYQTIEVVVTIGSSVRTFQKTKCLLVKARSNV